jgi:imidazole glycerol phosphate synthase subunit HisF
LDSKGVERAIELSENAEIEVIHTVADLNGDEIGVENPRFIKDMLREIHCGLIENGKRDEITLIGGGGIALAEHVAKALLCGADVISANLPFLVALECHLCKTCEKGMWCPAMLEDVDSTYATGRIVNLVGAWHGQLVELMGAMGMREARRLRGDVGRAMFFEQLEEESFGKLFGTRREA